MLIESWSSKSMSQRSLSTCDSTENESNKQNTVLFYPLTRPILCFFLNVHQSSHLEVIFDTMWQISYGRKYENGDLVCRLRLEELSLPTTPVTKFNELFSQYQLLIHMHSHLESEPDSVQNMQQISPISIHTWTGRIQSTALHTAGVAVSDVAITILL